MADTLPFLLLLSLAWLVYFGLHSLLASQGCKDWVARRWTVNERVMKLLFFVQLHSVTTLALSS